MPNVKVDTDSRLWRSAEAVCTTLLLASRRSWQTSGDVLAVVDAGPLYATVDRDDQDHVRCIEVFNRRDLDLVIPAMVVAEVTYLVGARLGPHIEARFLRGLREVTVRSPDSDDWDRIAYLVARYEDFPLGGTDASVIALAERLNTDMIITLDRRHFRAVRPRHCQAFQLLPNV